MRPFSAFYFMKENKSRCLLLMFMIFMTFGVYIGGLYITNPLDNWELPMEYYDNMVSVGGSAYDDEDYRYIIDKAIEDGKVTVVELGQYNGFGWETIMGFGSGNFSLTFKTVEDFKIYCEHVDLECDFDKLQGGSLIISEKFAKNRELELGSIIKKKDYSGVYDDYSIDEITDEEGYSLYFIERNPENQASAVLLGKSIHGKELYDYVYGLQNQVEDPLDIYVYDGVRADIGEQYAAFNLIYIFIAILFSIILAVTVNAAFIGMYQKREGEFAVYKAIGVPRRRIIGKIAGELLLMDLIALVIGAAITMLGLYLFNNMVLYPIGKYLRYYEGLALGNLILCNVIIIVPLIITRCRQLMKVDICEY